MTFTIHLLFASLAGIIFRPWFTTFYSCYMFCHNLSRKKLLFSCEAYVLQLMFDEFFLLITFFSHPLQLHAHHYLNGLPHSKHVSSQDVCLIYSSSSPILASTATLCSSLFSMVYHTLSMFHHKMFV